MPSLKRLRWDLNPVQVHRKPVNRPLDYVLTLSGASKIDKVARKVPSAPHECTNGGRRKTTTVPTGTFSTVLDLKARNQDCLTAWERCRCTLHIWGNLFLSPQAESEKPAAYLKALTGPPKDLFSHARIGLCAPHMCCKGSGYNHCAHCYRPRLN